MPKKQRRSRGKTRSRLDQRCERVFRFVARQQESVSRGQIARALGISPRAVERDTKKLRDEGRIKTLGTGGGTRYLAVANLASAGVPRRGPDPGRAGTLQGQILVLLGDRGWACEEELIQATRATPREVEAALAALVTEEEIELDTKQGRDVYMIKGS